MAFASSVVKGQFPIVCKLCEEEPKIRWKCLDCDLLMCQKCVAKIHPKFKNASDHKIIDVKDVGIHSDAEGSRIALDFNNIKCPQHQGQVCCLFCQTCDQVVCPSCFSKKHKTHELIEIIEGYQMKIKRLKEGRITFDKSRKEFSKQEKVLRDIKCTEKQEYDKVKKEILAHKTALQNDLEQYTSQLIAELDQEWKCIEQSNKEEQNKVETIIKQLDEIIIQTDTKMSLTDAALFFAELAEFRISADNLIMPELNRTNYCIPKFIPGEINKFNIGLLQKEIETTDIAHTSTELKMKIATKFGTKVSFVTFLRCALNNTLWIYSSPGQVLQRVNYAGRDLKTVLEFNIVVYGMAVTKSGDLLLATKVQIDQVNNTTGKITKSRYSVSPFVPTTVYVSKSDNKVLFGAMTEGPMFPVTGRRVLIVTDTEAKHQMVYEHDTNNKPLFAYPARITSTSGNTIGVINWLSYETNGEVVILGQRGNIIHIYKGHSDINGEYNPFKPTDIVTTASDRFIISDDENHTLHILNSGGQFLAYCITKDIGIRLPNALAFSPTGQLFIGCGLTDDSSDKANIYEVEISGC